MEDYLRKDFAHCVHMLLNKQVIQMKLLSLTLSVLERDMFRVLEAFASALKTF